MHQITGLIGFPLRYVQETLLQLARDALSRAKTVHLTEIRSNLFAGFLLGRLGHRRSDGKRGKTKTERSGTIGTTSSKLKYST